jgi:hypothetical protein
MTSRDRFLKTLRGEPVGHAVPPNVSLVDRMDTTPLELCMDGTRHHPSNNAGRGAAGPARRGQTGQVCDLKQFEQGRRQAGECPRTK